MEAIDQLSTFGYTVLKGVLTKTTCSSMLDSLEKVAARRIADNTAFFHNPSQTILRDVHLDAPDPFLSLLDEPRVDELVKQVFKDGYILQNMNASRANAAEGSPPHIDSRIAGVGMSHTTSLFAAFCITDFTVENGATKIWPFSHMSGLNPRDARFAAAELPTPVIATAEAGDVLVGLGQTWHQAGINLSGAPRWGCFTFFVPWWHRPNWDYRDCGEEIYGMLTPRQKEILGFTTQVPHAGSTRNYTKIALDALPAEYDKAKNVP